jgi:hypothetical protein
MIANVHLADILISDKIVLQLPQLLSGHPTAATTVLGIGGRLRYRGEALR